MLPDPTCFGTASRENHLARECQRVICGMMYGAAMFSSCSDRSPSALLQGSLTALEKETLSYVLEHFNVSQKASRYLESKLHPRKPGALAAWNSLELIETHWNSM